MPSKPVLLLVLAAPVLAVPVLAAAGEPTDAVGVAAPPTLEALLARVGASEKARLDAPTCRFTEETTMLSLAEDGSVEGGEKQTYEVVRGATGIVKREKVKVENIGAGLPTVFSLAGGGNGRQGDVQKPPLHPDSQPYFEITAAGPLDGPRAVLRLESKDPEKARVRGTATVETATGRVLELEVTPVKPPPFVETFRLKFTLAETPCGRQATRVETSGAATIAFVAFRFRSDSKLSGHAPAPPSASE